MERLPPPPRKGVRIKVPETPASEPTPLLSADEDAQKAYAAGGSSARAGNDKKKRKKR